MTEIHFDTNYNPEQPVFVLANRAGNKQGGLLARNIKTKGSLLNADEVSFVVYKYEDGKLNYLWDKITDFKLIWNKDSDIWYEIKVEMDESLDSVKNIYGKQLGNAELSQLKLYSIEINTEKDIARDDYEVPTVLYNPDNPEASLLHRIGEKSRHYKIEHVDNTIKDIQRTFTFDDISITDAHNQIAEEIGCLFVYHSDSNADGRPHRAYSVFDLYSNCECGYRGEFTGKCPKCGSSNISEGYGEDTTIFITADELAHELHFSTDTDAVKNCFKLEAGDDLMTATIRNCNPNGSDYIWYISDQVKSDMSQELVDMIENYDSKYSYYQNEYEFELDCTEYNELINKYVEYKDDLEEFPETIVGYSMLMNAYYDTIDFALYLKSVLMPDVEMSDTTAEKQALLLTSNNLSPVAVANIDTVSKASADNAVLSMAKVIVDSRYQVKINTSSFDEASNIWSGKFIVQNYADEEDMFTSNQVQVVVNGDYETFIRQKLEKAINEDEDNFDLSALFEMELDNFKAELKKYCLERLESFHNTCQTCIDILIEMDISNSSLWGSDLSETIYDPYYKKLVAIESEMKLRQDEIYIITCIIDNDGTIIKDGIQSVLEREISRIQSELDFESFICKSSNGSELWVELCSHRREDKYTNSNYISDGLSNKDLILNAMEFIETAKNEIYKSAEMQHTISSTLKNLLVIDKFKALVKYFKVGNWLRVLINDKVYKLRLLEYEIDFDNLDELPVEFSDVLKTSNGISDQQSIMNKLTSMTTTYESVQRQANQGAKNNDVLQTWFNDGLNTTQVNIISGTENQTQSWDSHGMLFRAYDPITETYDPRQTKIINSTIAITDDNWASTKTAIGRFSYISPETNEVTNAYGINGETIVGRLILGENLGIYNSSSSLKFDKNGLNISGSQNTVSIDPNNSSIIRITKTDEDDPLLSFSDDGDLLITGILKVQGISFAQNVHIDSDNVSGLHAIATSGNHEDLDWYFSGKYTELDFDGAPEVSKTGLYTDLDFTNAPKVAETGKYSDLLDKPTIPTVTHIIASDDTAAASSKAVYNFAVPKDIGTDSAGKLLYVGSDGKVTTITINDLKALLG